MATENRRFLFGVFEREEDILAATRTAREGGLCIADVYTPFAVHGLDKAMDKEAFERIPIVQQALAGAPA